MKRKREMEKRAKKLRRRLRQRHLRLGNKRHRDNYDYKAARTRHDVMQNDERSVGLSRKTLGIKQGHKKRQRQKQIVLDAKTRRKRKRVHRKRNNIHKIKSKRKAKRKNRRKERRKRIRKNKRMEKRTGRTTSPKEKIAISRKQKLQIHKEIINDLKIRYLKQAMKNKRLRKQLSAQNRSKESAVSQDDKTKEKTRRHKG